MARTKRPYKNLIGQRFGRLLVVSLIESPAGASTPTKWRCQCDCGNVVVVRGCNLKSGGTSSCGCLQRELAAERNKKHGQTGSRLYVIWQHMIGRCNRKSDKAYKWYGGIGITICDEWLNSFEAFFKWSMENGYSENLTIDRIDPNGNYSPENCRWITLAEQQRNRRDAVMVEFNGQIKHLCEWAEFFKCRPQTVYREILLREGRVHGCEKND